MFVKLFGSILDSSIWETDCETRVVWITMLAMANEYGVVSASVTGLARRAVISTVACERALRILGAPDQDDRSGVAEGRRITALQGGWQLVNYKAYRELRSTKQIVAAMRQRKHRAGQHGVTTPNGRDESPVSVTSNDVTTEAEAEAEKTPLPPFQRHTGSRAASRARSPNGAPLRRGPSTTSEARQIVARILSYAGSHNAPSGGVRRFIPKDQVAALGPDILRAYDAVGGADRFLSDKPDALKWLPKEFGDALAGVREQATFDA